MKIVKPFKSLTTSTLLLISLLCCSAWGQAQDPLSSEGYQNTNICENTQPTQTSLIFAPDFIVQFTKGKSACEIYRFLDSSNSTNIERMDIDCSDFGFRFSIVLGKAQTCYQFENQIDQTLSYECQSAVLKDGSNRGTVAKDSCHEVETIVGVRPL